MALPLLNYAPASQNSRVAGFTVGSDNSPRIYNTANLLSSTELDDLIEAAYRQIFFHAFATDREVTLESQLRSGNISVRQFVRGLILSDTYRRSFYEKNSNYRFVEQTVQRVLGRDVYSEKEKIAWSIVVATKGIEGFIDALLNSDEYLEAFGDDTLPYQRRRVLPSQAIGEVPFNIKSPRYDAYHRAQLGFPQLVWQNTVRSYVVTDRAPKTGDPALFLNMARSINANPVNSTPVSAQNLDYERLVPRR
ncbi:MULTISPECIES: phycobilisome rod-core linker polypeptide [Pseudanabaena]|uniref:Phycobilisome linker polypeptide n=2 Tax=Pseudanabaena TaxID=1152 RepID=L8N2E3_9CYAN|nr:MULTISPECIES: phycobilisome rod-core linker polypeptide [Pseudanabaena]ELS33856.1 Phycobilisome linker polypeptide [Pseudanabaena biceps PCC 7429]MDG3493951.1 phycobilisome rod-core linker polypeptide [Pseudanabaena catenata USMAC16]